MHGLDSLLVTGWFQIAYPVLHSSLRLHQFVANQGPKPHSILGILNHIRGSYLTSYIMFDYYAADRVHRNPYHMRTSMQLHSLATHPTRRAVLSPKPNIAD